MEEINGSSQESPRQEPAAPKSRFGLRFWLQAACALYALSLFAAFSVAGRQEAASKARRGETELSGLKGLVPGKKDAVAVIPIYGGISQGNTGRTWERGSQQIARRIRSAAEKKEVKAVLLDINSPGGSVGAVQEIYSAVMKARKETGKPFVARFGEVSASGGYYVAAACDKIVAHPGTITGSIGVIFSVGNFEGLLKKIGVKMEPIKSGKFKDMGSPSREMTAEEKKLLQGMIDDSYGQFVEAVAAGRGMPVEQVKLLADGRIFTGRQAQEAKLVDALGDYRDALDLAGELGKIGKNPKVINETDPLDNFFSLMETRLNPLGQAAAALQAGPRLEYRWYAE
jgi:protease IV